MVLMLMMVVNSKANTNRQTKRREKEYKQIDCKFAVSSYALFFVAMLTSREGEIEKMTAQCHVRPSTLA